MPLVGTDLGDQLAASLAIVDVRGKTKWRAIGSLIVSTLTSTTVTAPGAMNAESPPLIAVAGLGLATFGGAAALAVNFPAAAGMTNTIGIPFLKAIGAVIGASLAANLKIDPTGFIANGAGGPLLGSGKVLYVDPTLGSLLSAAAGIVPVLDVPGNAAWNGLAATIVTYISTNARANSLGFTSPPPPPGGGPIAGASTIS